jgi:hypothetical protein
MNPFKNTILCVTLVSIQLLSIVFVNVTGLIGDYQVLSDEKDTQQEDLKIGTAITSSPIFKAYSNYSGTNSSYGFFSPNVGSEFVMSFAVLDRNGKRLGEHQAPASLEQNESIVRFNMCSFPMMDKIMLEETNELLDKYFEVMMHQIAENVKNHYETGYKVISEIYIHQPPTIKEAQEGKQERLILLERYTFRFE